MGARPLLGGHVATERIHFLAHSEDAPSLEGELWLPNTLQPGPGVVVAHPHPQRGGNMDNNVVMAICTGLQRAGVASLRFNFRGVGHSGGKSVGGSVEVTDVLGALAFLETQPRVLPSAIGLAGYSFGARMSLAAVAGTDSIQALLCVAPPLREALPWDQHPSCPFLSLVGDRDGLVADGTDRYASFLPDPESLRVVAGTDHFWWGYEDILIDATQEFFAQHLVATLSG